MTPSRFLVTPDNLRHEFPAETPDQVVEQAARQHMAANALVDVPTHAALGQLDAARQSAGALEQQVQVGMEILTRLDMVAQTMQLLIRELAASRAAVSDVAMATNALNQTVAAAAAQLARAMVADRDIVTDANGLPAKLRFNAGVVS